jgi:hypothetical protein
MSSNDAQRSPVHQATEDSASEPLGPTAPPSMTPPPGQAESDARGADRSTPDAADRNDPDESSFGGPLKLDDPDASR